MAALARAKARRVALSGPLPAFPAVVLGADTEVVLDGRLLGKPRDRDHAASMLGALRGRTHEVITAVALMDVSSPGTVAREEVAVVSSQVRMAQYSDAEIQAYVETEEPFDKAGGYAVQGAGGRLVAAVEGCYTNVVGLPLTTTRRMLERWGML